MIEENGKHYLYRHIRLDKNEPFYIGIGTKEKKNYNSITRKYRRAFSFEGRSNYWISITNKVKYEVEILLESNDYEFIKEKEKEFITLYGRKDLGTGILCNLTDGGEGLCGKIFTEEQKIKLRNRKRAVMTEDIKVKISKANKGRKFSKESIDKIRKTKGYIEKQEKIKEFIKSYPQYSISEIKKIFKANYITIKKLKEELNIVPLPIIYREDGKEYFTEVEACRDMGVSKGCIQKCIQHGWKVKGFLFKYIKENYEGKNKKNS